MACVHRVHARCQLNRHIRTFSAVSSFAKSVRAKSPVHAAQTQLAFLPEAKRLDQEVPPGRYLRMQQGSTSNTICSGAATDAARVIDICNGMGAGGGNAYLKASLQRAVAQSESCGDLVSARKYLERLAESAGKGVSADGADLDSLDGYARGLIAEVQLALARLHISGALPSTSSALSDAASALAASSAASSVSEDLAYAQAKGDAAAVAALLPNALAHARAHALAVLLNKLKAGITTQEPDRAPKKPSEEEPESTGRPLTPEEAQLEQVVRACLAADEAVVRVMHTVGEEKESSAMTARYVHGRTAVIRASARRNLACTHLLSATAHMSASVRESLTSSQQAAAAGAQSVGIPLSSQYALAHLTTAHEHLTSALEQINTAATRHRDLSAASKKESETAQGGPAAVEGVTQGPEAGVAAGKGLLADSEGWRRLGWDLRAMRADLAASTAEVGVLMALWTVWMPGAASLMGQSPAGAAGGAEPAAAEGTLFPLNEEENEAVTPVLKTASAAAEAALREYESLDAAYHAGVGSTSTTPTPSTSAASTATEQAQAFSDHGLDAGAGIIRALRVIALLHQVSSKAVTAEGLLRSGLDSFQAIRLTSGGRPGAGAGEHGARGSGGSLGGYDEAMKSWKTLPVLHQANIAGLLHPYAALLRQWEKREREAERLAAHAKVLLDGACAPLKVQPPKPSGDAKVDFLAAQTMVLALSSAHVGSWGMVMPLDYTSI